MKKVFVLSVQPDPEGPVFGRVMDPTDFQNSQDFSHQHIEQITRDLLVSGAPGAQVAGFQATVAGGLNVSVAKGTVVDPLGISYDSPDAASVVTVGAAHVSLPRIDLIVASLEIDAQANSEFRPFRQLRTQAELEAGVPPYLPNQFNQPTELHTRATITVKPGVPNAAPVPPAPGANEVPLWQVHVAAGQAVLVAGDLTSVRVLMKSLWQVLQDVATLQGQMAVLTETVQDVVGVFILEGPGIDVLYNDAANTFTVSLEAALKALLDNATNLNTANALVKRDAAGNFRAGVANLNPAQTSLGVGSAGGNAGVQLVAPTNALTGLFDLRPVGTTGGIKFAVAPDGAGQNTPALHLYQARGNDDNLRMHFDGFGRSHIYGKLTIEVGNSPSGSGDLEVIGNLTKGSGTFKIDHPLDPDNKDLLHAFTESPRFDLIYRGFVALVAGEAIVDIDAASGMTAGTFALLTQNPQVWLQNKTGWAKVRVKAGTFAGGSFTIEADDPGATDTVEWLVIAERDDEYIHATEGTDANGHLLVEVDKPVGDLNLLSPVTRIVNLPDAAPDDAGQEVVAELVGKQGFPRHAQITGQGNVPVRDVVIQYNDMEGNPYAP